MPSRLNHWPLILRVDSPHAWDASVGIGALDEFDAEGATHRRICAIPLGDTPHDLRGFGIGREESLEELLSYTDLKAINVMFRR